MVSNDKTDLPPKRTIIWLHGLGDTGEGFSDLFRQHILPKMPEKTKVILPNAPSRPITINNGELMPAWYDIVSFKRETEDKPGINEVIFLLIIFKTNLVSNSFFFFF